MVTATATMMIQGQEVLWQNGLYHYTTKAGYARIACNYCLFNRGKLRIAKIIDVGGMGLCPKCNRAGAGDGGTPIQY